MVMLQDNDRTGYRQHEGTGHTKCEWCGLSVVAGEAGWQCRVLQSHLLVLAALASRRAVLAAASCAFL